MKWPQVIAAMVAEIMANPTLSDIYGQNVRKMGTGSHLVPCLEWMKIGDAEDEIWNPVTVQWDQWCFTHEDFVASETMLRRIFHQDLPVVYNGLRCWTQYADDQQLTSPDRDDFHGGSIRFRLTPLRSKYDPVPSTS